MGASVGATTLSQNFEEINAARTTYSARWREGNSYLTTESKDPRYKKFAVTINVDDANHSVSFTQDGTFQGVEFIAGHWTTDGQRGDVEIYYDGVLSLSKKASIGFTGTFGDVADQKNVTTITIKHSAATPKLDSVTYSYFCE